MKASPGLIDDTEDAVPGLLVDYTQEQKVVSFDIRLASVRTRAQFLGHCHTCPGCPTSVFADNLQLGSQHFHCQLCG